jgi:hypothetical protein
MRILFAIVGSLLMIFGVFFALQGAGVIMWPAESFMLASSRWVLYGALIAAAGALLIWSSRRRGS